MESRKRLVALLALISVVVVPTAGTIQSNDAVARPNANPFPSELKEVPPRLLALLDAGRSKKADKCELMRVTTQAYEVEPKVAAMCVKNSFSKNPHAGTWIHVYVTLEGREAMLSGKGVYPQGTIILKQKFVDSDAKPPVAYTGMIKREKGYNPQAGDWEFFVTSRTANRVHQSGKIQSCIDCHTPFKSTDFVSRRYLTATDDRQAIKSSPKR